MHRVTRALGNHMPQQRPSQQREVADQIQRLVAAAFIRSAQALGIQYAGRGEAHGVLQRRPADQPHVAHLVQVGFPTEGARERDLRRVPLRRHFELQRHPAHRRLIIRIARQPETVGRQNRNALPFVLHRNRPADAKVAALAAELADAGIFQQLHER